METYSTSKIQSWLSWFLRGVLFLGFFILFARLFDLQIIRGPYFRELAEGNRIRRVPIEAPRGKIFSRGGEILVRNKEIMKRVIFFPEKGYQKVLEIETSLPDEIITEPEREYLLSERLAHTTGYIGEVNEEEVGKVDPACPKKGPRRLGSHIGRTGLEEEYDCLLRGVDGEELIEVDSGGNMIRVLGRRDAIPGQDLKTSINYKLQEKVAALLGNMKGAIVITDNRGEILAAYSSPSFDPNIFISGGKETEISEVLTDENLPLFNRLISGLFHPGSVVKPIIAIAALEEGEIDKNYIYNDTGAITIDSIYGDFSYTNWYFTQYGGTEGEIGVVRAIARSTDTFFYKMGELLGVERIIDWMDKFGLDGEAGIDIPGEVPGLVPSPEWKEKVKGERWFLGNTYHMSIGQGDIALTPIGINTAISTIASGGKYCSPRIVTSQVLGNDQFTIYNLQCKNLEISSGTLDIVTEGMIAACSVGGTAYTFFDTGIDVACKTGTAETTDEKDPHAWFTFFAPVDDPEIVVTVLVENGGEGSKVAGPIAREIYDFWFTE